MARRVLSGIGCVILVGLVLFGLIQLIPYGHNHTNPPVVQEPNWNSPTTRNLAVLACFDCHSNETKWYWYSNIAPFSWLIQRDIDEGRRRLNFSDWTRTYRVGEISETVLRGGMPPIQYIIIHPASNLPQQDRQTLADGLQQTVLNSP